MLVCVYFKMALKLTQGHRQWRSSTGYASFRQ